MRISEAHAILSEESVAFADGSEVKNGTFENYIGRKSKVS